MDKKSKKEKENEDNIDDFLNCEDEEEINDIIKKAQQELKDEEEKKKKGIVDDDEKPKKKKKKKKKYIEEEEEEDEEDDKEEFRKWKEQKKKLEKLKKEKEKEKMKKKKKKTKDNSDDDDDENESDSDDLPKKSKKKKKETKKKKKLESDEEEEEEEEEEENISDEEPSLPKKVSQKIKSNDLKMVLNVMKKCNMKYQEGVDLCKEGNYEESLDYLKHAKSSFLGLNKMIQSNTDAYPKEFRQIMDSKINDKIKSIHQSAKKCLKLKKEKNDDFLSNNNYGNNNSNSNFNSLNNNNINNNNNRNNQKNLHDKEEDEMDKKIESEIMVKNPKVKFSDIIGMQDMKQTLYEIIVVPTIRPDLFTGIRKPQRGILLFGPPGTGKTMIAKAIASECNSTFFNISASSLTSKWVGESEKTVKSLFKIAYKKVPSIIFIDEIDSILSKRSESENEATKRLKTEFLIQFDGLGSNTNARLLVIAATNRPMDLDEALLRRLPKRVYCGPLDEQGRFEFIKKVINRVEVNLSDDDIREIAKKTNDYSNSDLMELCREAAYQPVRELTMDEILKIQKFRPLVKQDLLNAVKKIRGTLSKKVRDELQKWNEQFGGV